MSRMPRSVIPSLPVQTDLERITSVVRLSLSPALCGDLRYVASAEGCPGIPEVRSRVRRITGRSFHIVKPSPFPHFLEVRQCLSDCFSVLLR